MNTLKNKIALITGGTSGMGAATAKRFHEEGATVIVTGSNPTSVDAARKAMLYVEPSLRMLVTPRPPRCWSIG
jgi:NAD(P)-dependent dehydrogenase (short-subunit alcohol dehydrogenase family)